MEKQASTPAGEMTATELSALACAIKSGPREIVRAFFPLLKDKDEAARILLRILEEVPDGESPAIIGFHALPLEQCERILLSLARHRRETVRFTLFRLMTRNYKLSEPYSLRPPLSDAGMDELTRLGLVDESPRVRERAAAFAHGTGRVDPVQKQLIAGTRDPVERCRWYCLLALGVAQDEHTHKILTDAFYQGDEPQATVAIWALARRPDGIPTLTRALNVTDSQLRGEILSALNWANTDAAQAWPTSSLTRSSGDLF